ncbi:hypothetical protein [Herbidospora cretacea]|uniref:hypothetical protein n=1 Tax=Herbidospora cretacea TaxID=28444 RepID=UPI000B0C89EE|nr:hypothetical protein [Herbidospora cretacea]
MSAQTFRLELQVQDCGVVHLREVGGEDMVERGLRCGDVEVRDGVADLVISVQWGDDIPFTVTLADEDPGADLDDYEDVMEIDYFSPSGRVLVEGFTYDWDVEKVVNLPPLPAGPGNYRLRYHVRGSDWEACGDDDHHLQIWPSEPAGPVVVQAVSQSFQCQVNPGVRFEDPQAWEDIERRALAYEEAQRHRAG